MPDETDYTDTVSASDSDVHSAEELADGICKLVTTALADILGLVLDASVEVSLHAEEIVDAADPLTDDLTGHLMETFGASEDGARAIAAEAVAYIRERGTAALLADIFNDAPGPLPTDT